MPQRSGRSPARPNSRHSDGGARNVMTPIAPSTTRALIGDAREIHNLHLRLFTLLPKELATGTGVPKEDSKLKRRLYQDLEPLLEKASEVLGKLAERQKLLAEAGGSRPVCLELTSNFTCGMSQPTLLENGLTLLRPYGIPILPASSIKGALASWLAEILSGKLNLSEKEEEKALNESGFLPLFGFGTRAGGRGEEGQTGLVKFFDALPVGGPSSGPWLEADITTVHHQSWYEGKQGATPAGFENPVPIPFLTVRKGTRFQFCFVVPDKASLSVQLSNGQDTALEKFGIKPGNTPAGFLEDLLVSTARYKGFGSQTAKGYGRMERCA